MSVATKNPFAILDEVDSRPSSPPPPAPAADSAPAKPPARANQKSSGGPASRGGKYYARGGGAKSAPKDSGNPNQNGIEEPAGAQTQRKFDNRGRGGRGGRGSRGTGRGRPFDKHSQTGKTDSEKKVHQGWGGDDGTSELKTEVAASNDAANDAVAADDAWGAAAADTWADVPATSTTEVPATEVTTPVAEKTEGEGRPRRQRDVEEEDNTLTLDQYLAQQKEKEAGLVPKLEGLRVANDGDEWKDVVPLQKTEDNAYFVGKGKTAPKARAKKDEKVYLEIEPRFERPNRGQTRGGRGRGGDRGSRGRGGGRGGRTSGDIREAAFNLDDESSFPSLS